MHILIIVVICLFLLVVAFFGYHLTVGFKRALRSNSYESQAYTEANKATIDQIPALNEECIRTFREKLNVVLTYDDPEKMAQILDDAVRSDKLVEAFAKPEFPWYFVLPMGAFVGELMRHNSTGEWTDSGDYGPTLTIKRHVDNTKPDEIASLSAYPLNKIVKQRAGGDPGDLYAYVMMGLSSSIDR